MNWISKLNTPGHISQAINNFNNAIDDLKNKRSVVEVSRYLFDAMNNVQTELAIFEQNQDWREVQNFQKMFLSSFDDKDLKKLLNSSELNNLISFEPQIMNHDTLRRNNHRPDQEINENLSKKAREVHKKLFNAFAKFLSIHNDETQERVLKKMAELLYIVRSNINHGDKTPYGPDHKQTERNKNVCEIVVPLQILIMNLLFENSDHKLVVYGTLAPGKVNHEILSSIEGTWDKCKINGHIFKKNGLPYFARDPNESQIEAHLFSSNLLPDSWNRLDQFEGSGYKRVLIPVTRTQGICVASIFVEERP